MGCRVDFARRDCNRESAASSRNRCRMATQTLSPAVPWKVALPLAAAAVYGPFVVMATYATFFESSSYVREYAWFLLAWAPGLLHVDTMSRALHLPRFGSDAASFAFAFVSTLFTIFALAWVLRQVRWLGYLALAGAVAWFSYSAVVLLSLLRM